MKVNLDIDQMKTCVKQLNDHELNQSLKKCVKNLHEEALRALIHFREVETRELAISWGYHSLYQYAAKSFGLSEGAAARYSQAAKLSLERPSILKEIASGEMSLSLAAQTYKALMDSRRWEKEKQKKENASTREPQSESIPLGTGESNQTNNENEKTNKKDQKQRENELFENLKGKKGAEAKGALNAFKQEACGKDPNEKPQGKVKFLSEELVKMEAYLTKEQYQKFEKLIHLLSHSNPQGDPNQLLDKLLELGLNELDPQRKAKKTKSKKKQSSVKSQASVKSQTKDDAPILRGEALTSPFVAPHEL
jgi:hypothetical protein